jgi:hypothetical protein
MFDTISWIKYEETTKHIHIKAAPAGSQILGVFKIGDISAYHLSLPQGSAIFRVFA